jgi:hypothetical protein
MQQTISFFAQLSCGGILGLGRSLFGQGDRTCLDFSRKGAEIPTFFSYSGFLPRFKHPALGQVVRQIRGTLSIGIILANLTEMGPLSWFFLRFPWNLKADEKSKTKGHQSGFTEDSLGISWSF